MNNICFECFKFYNKLSVKEFYKYKLINNNPYGNSYKDIFSFGNSIKKENNKMFVFVDKSKQCVYTSEIISKVPNDKNIFLDNEYTFGIVPLEQNTIELYQHYVEYIINKIIKMRCKSNNYQYTYNYKYDNTFYCDIYDTSGKVLYNNKLGFKVRYKFKISVKINLDGSTYLFVALNCDFLSNTLDYYISNKIPVSNMEVEYLWDNFPNFKVVEVLNHSISETVDGFCLEDYWRKKAPYRLKNIDCQHTPVVVIENIQGKIKRKGNYIPQSLRPVIRYDFIAKHDSGYLSIIRPYMLMSMQKRLNVITGFLNAINSSLNTPIIDVSRPVSTEELGYKVADLKSNLPRLIVGNNQRLSIAQRFKVFNYGFYRVPKSAVTGVCMYFEDCENDCRNIMKTVSNYLNNGYLCTQKLLPMNYNKNPFPYKCGDLISYKEVATEIKTLKVADFVLSVLPDDENFNNSDDFEITSPYEPFKDVFSELNMPSQMISLKSFKSLRSDYDKKYYLQNVALGILCKCGGVPWILERPLNDVDCFIGLDVGTQERGIHIPASSVCLDGNGNLIGYYKPKSVQNGEKIDKDMLHNILSTILLRYKELNNIYPKHIVIHRDGFSNEELSWYDEILGKKNIEYDLVEVKKRVGHKIVDLHSNEELNPIPSTCIINEELKSAYVITTKIIAKKGGSPNPIELIHKHGNLSMYDIALQVYVLSQIHIGSTMNGRLPITTLYADKICKKHKFIPSGEVSNKLYFL